SCGAQGDVIAMVEALLAVDTLPIDIRAVQTTQVAQHVAVTPLLDQAMLFGYDLVEQLDRVRWVAAKRVLGAQFDDLLSFRCCKQKTRHLKIERLSLDTRQYNRKPGGAPILEPDARRPSSARLRHGFGFADFSG